MGCARLEIQEEGRENMTATPRREEPRSPIVESYGEAMVEELMTVHHRRVCHLTCEVDENLLRSMREMIMWK